ncbi:hypothetical protein C7K25_02495 [Gulosibacter molinativorax]|uniref:Lipoprotein n=2 Tax=Gulosibacter molinativorax TaxID=256821 RepID=A0ABT7C4X4_9MICO|nr:hypothetical protein [Gulosibacter molinativorax]QUY61666.1 Hypotetical protein [Gulosibacter molinativorax]
MKTHYRRRFATILALAGALLITGCASTETDPAPASPDANVIDGGNTSTLDLLISDGLANAQSDFQREVLQEARESGQISEDDWKEANNQYKACLVAKGYEVEVIYNGTDVLIQGEAETEGTVDEQKAAGELRQQADRECYEKTSAFINEIYSYLNGGQQAGGLDGDTVQRAVLACLIDRDLVPSDTSYDGFLADLEQNGGKQFTPNGQENEEDIAACWVENT